MRRPAPLACLVAIGLAAPATVIAAPGWDLLEPERGNETPATAAPIGLATTLEDRVVVGPPSVRDVDHFVVRARRGTRVTVLVDHHGETHGRPLAVGVPRSARDDRVRWRIVRDGRTTTTQARVGRDGRLVVAVRCAGTDCDRGGAIPYRLVTGTSVAKARRRAARAATLTRDRASDAATTSPDESGGTTPDALASRAGSAGEPSGGAPVGD
ncbi:MAG: hypothetical protein M0P31_11800 [Solirubrobacteraceae bacterium]|nr:hypothetical protein [Solirubrobacteraceae bacterium]